MKPFLCRVGTKRDIADKLIEMFPPHIIYVEPFVGGGAVLFSKEPSDYEIINDLDKDLIDTYRTIKKIKNYDFKDDLHTLDDIQKFYNQPITSDSDYLKHQIIKYCNGFSSKLIDEKLNKVYNYRNPYTKLKNIEDYKQRLKNVKIYNQSYEKIIKKFDSNDTFFYLDPPYMYSSYSAQYKHSDLDYDKLFKILSNINGKFLLSLNDNSYIRKLFKPFYMKKIYIKPKGGTGVGLGKTGRNELLITNYKL